MHEILRFAQNDEREWAGTRPAPTVQTHKIINVVAGFIPASSSPLPRRERVRVRVNRAGTSLAPTVQTHKIINVVAGFIPASRAGTRGRT